MGIAALLQYSSGRSIPPARLQTAPCPASTHMMVSPVAVTASKAVFVTTAAMIAVHNYAPWKVALCRVSTPIMVPPTAITTRKMVPVPIAALILGYRQRPQPPITAGTMAATVVHGTNFSVSSKS